MHHKNGFGFVVLIIALLGCAATARAQTTQKPGINVAVNYYKLPNGLRVVLSPDTSAPIATVGIYYNIGFRIEPRDRTGFAHLFEHMMFQGSRNLGKTEYIKLVESNGGVLNGSTRFDFTNYFSLVPSNKLETMLWAEADRMRGLDITQANLTNQQGVVSNEVKVNVLNQPYGGFWIDLPMAANTNWHNAHNFYGDLKDLEAATLDDVKKFFTQYYAPNNAALVVVGDFKEADAKQFVEKYFGNIPSSKLDPKPDLTEPRQTEEKKIVKTEKLAKKPALTFGYQMPARNTPEYYAMGLLEQILLQGDDSLLHQELVKKRGYTDSVSGGINFPLGDMFNVNGPTLFSAFLIHDERSKPEEILAAMDAVIANVQNKPVEQKTIDRALVKLRSRLYDTFTQFGGLGKVDLLATYALFDDKPEKINEIETEFRRVTPALIQKAAQEYLRSTNRTTVVLQPEAAAKTAE